MLSTIAVIMSLAKVITKKCAGRALFIDFDIKSDPQDADQSMIRLVIEQLPC